MPKKISEHLQQFKFCYMMVLAALMLMGGLSSYQKDVSFYGGGPKWLVASVLQAPKANAYTRGEFVMDVVARMKKSKCYKDLCADMKGGTPEEKARCNLEKRGVFTGGTVDYKWYDQEFNRGEAIKTIVTAFKIPVVDGAKEPFTDVEADAWYTPYVAAAVQSGLVKDNAKHQFKPADLTKPTWAKTLLRKAKLAPLCEKVQK